MHLPDGQLGPGSSSIFIMAAVGAVSFAMAKVRQTFFARERKLVMKTPEGAEFSDIAVTKLTKLGKSKVFYAITLTAFVFVMQTMDFPINPGVPGHFLGSALMAIVLGPWLAILLLSGILILQATMLGDGGIIALGANIVSMSIIGCLAGHYIYHYFKNKYTNLLAGFFAAWGSVIIMAVAHAAILMIAGMAHWQTMSWHFVYGIGEGIVTVLILIGIAYRDK